MPCTDHSDNECHYGKCHYIDYRGAKTNHGASAVDVVTVVVRVGAEIEDARHAGKRFATQTVSNPAAVGLQQKCLKTFFLSVNYVIMTFPAQSNVCW